MHYKTNDSILNNAVIIVADRCRRGGIAVEPQHINCILMDLHKRDLKGLNRRFISQRDMFLDAAADIAHL